jgi:nucleoside 2-deoxyribosyltransferase
LIRADEISDVGHITERIIKIISETDLIIANLSKNNPNVMFELGLARSFDKPIILLIPNGESVPFDIVGFETLIYLRTRLQETLARPLRNLLAHKKSCFISQKKESRN